MSIADIFEVSYSNTVIEIINKPNQEVLYFGQIGNIPYQLFSKEVERMNVSYDAEYLVTIK